MFKSMVIALAMSATVQAAQTTATFLLNGKSISPEQAIMAATNGEQVFKCQPVIAQLSKSGTSISLKTPKKPKRD
jgi:hypothetical protein